MKAKQRVSRREAGNHRFGGRRLAESYLSVSPQPGFLHQFSELDTLGIAHSGRSNSERNSYPVGRLDTNLVQLSVNRRSMSECAWCLMELRSDDGSTSLQNNDRTH
jgi:hypothetical protein